MNAHSSSAVRGPHFDYPLLWVRSLKEIVRHIVKLRTTSYCGFSRDGTEVAKLIREFNPTIPIVFYSAASYEADKQAAFDAGADAYLTKPMGFGRNTHAPAPKLSDESYGTDENVGGNDWILDLDEEPEQLPNLLRRLTNSAVL